MAVPAAGSFTASQLLKVQAIADKRWMDPIKNQDYVPHCETIKAMMAEQTPGVSFQELEGTKDNTVRLTWLNACNTTTSAPSDDCVVGGPELATDARDYTLSLVQETGFSIKEKKTRSDTFTVEDQISLGFLNAIKNLDEWWNKQALAALEANRGTNAYLPTGWLNASSDTTIPTASFTKAMIPKLVMIGTKNRFSSPYIISGEAMWEEAWEAAVNQANAEGKGDAARMNQIRRYHDLFWIDALNDPNIKFYMVNRGSLAVITKAYYGDRPTMYKTQDRFSVPSRSLAGVRYDVIYDNKCASNEVTHNFTFQTKGLIALNPTGCTETRTGVMAFRKVA